MKYEKPEMEILIFNENDIATNLVISDGKNPEVDFGDDFEG